MKKITTIKAAAGFDEAGNRIRKQRVCAYCRVSTSHIEQQASFDAQIRHYKAFIENKEDWQFSGIYADEGISGKTKKNRTEFLKMLRDAECGKLDLIITKSISRFARNTTDCIETVRFLKNLGVGVMFEKEHINTLSAESELVLTILSSIAEEELSSLSQNICWSNQKKFKQGKIQLVTERFMGYDRDGKGGLVINEEQAEIVKRIFMDYISGLGVTPIARRLEADGIKTITGGANWNTSVVLGMLKNEKYVGDVILQKSVTANNLTFKRKANEGEAPMYYIKDNHPAIINREDFELVQELKAERRRSKGNSPEMSWKYQNRYPFSSKILCGNCGETYRHMVHNSKQKTQQYFWGCGTYIDRKVSTCDMKPIKNDTVERLFVRMFNKLYMNKSFLTKYAETLRLVNDIKAESGTLHEINNQIEELILEEHVLLELKEKGVTDAVSLMAQHEELIGNLSRLRSEKNKLVSEIDNGDDRLRKTKQFITLVNETIQPLETFDDALFDELVKKIIVRDRECLVFCLENGMELAEGYKIRRGKDVV